MKRIHPNKRCPCCREYNMRIAVNRKRYGVRYFAVCMTPGCWFYTQEARTKNGAIRNWNKEAGRAT